MGPKYIAAGGLRIDYLITADGQAHLREMGGNAPYAAVGARIWSPDAAILSRVGANYPAEWLRRLEDAGICTEGVRWVPGWQEMRTFYAYLDPETRVDTDPERYFSRLSLPLPDDLMGYVHSTPGQDGQDYSLVSPRPDDLPASFWGAQAAHLSPLELPSQRALPPALAEKGIHVSLDPGERYMKPSLAHAVFSLLGHVDVFLPSQQEVESLLGEGDRWEAAHRFAAAGPEVVVIKAGAMGSLLYDRSREERWIIPPCTANLVDVTGAGDAYCGGFMVGFLEIRDPVLAGCCGAVAASFVLEGFGALYALRHTRAEAELRLAATTRAVKRI